MRNFQKLLLFLVLIISQARAGLSCESLFDDYWNKNHLNKAPTKISLKSELAKAADKIDYPDYFPGHGQGEFSDLAAMAPDKYKNVNLSQSSKTLPPPPSEIHLPTQVSKSKPTGNFMAGTLGKKKLDQWFLKPREFHVSFVPTSRPTPHTIKPFGEFTVGDVTLNHKDLPQAAKEIGPERVHAFYGKDFSKYPDLLSGVADVFARGIYRRNGHRNVLSHLNSSEGKNSAQDSAWANYTPSRKVAFEFGQVSFVHDLSPLKPGEAAPELLYVPEIWNVPQINRTPIYLREREILTVGPRAPQTIIGALVRGPNSEFDSYTALFNPHYQGQDKVQIAMAKRFLDPHHFEGRAVEYLSSEEANPIKILRNFYGEDAMDSFQNGVRHVEKNAGERLPSLKDFQDLHKIALEKVPMPFESYVINLAKSGARNGDRKIDYHRLRSLMRKQEDQTIKDEMGIEVPRSGQLRNFGEFGFNTPLMSESSGSGMGYSSLFREKQMVDFVANSKDRNGQARLKIEKKEVAGSDIGESLFKAEFSYPNGQDVPRLVEESFDLMNKEAEVLKQKLASGENTAAQHEEAVVDLAARFYRDLITIHPFWDGNGRSSKLARDWVMLHLGVPPPSHTPVNEFGMTHSELVDAFKKGVAETRLIYKDGRAFSSP